MAEQVAQKLHACTSPHATGRARDVLDILLVEMLHGLDFIRTADAVQRVFTARATHAFPPEFQMPKEWRPEIEALAAQLGMAETRAAQIEERFRTVLQRIAEAMPR